MAASLVVGHDVESSFLWVAIGEKAKYRKIRSGCQGRMVGAIANSPTNLKICGKILPILPNGTLYGKIPAIYLTRDVMQKLSAYSPILGCYVETFSLTIVMPKPRSPFKLLVPSRD